MRILALVMFGLLFLQVPSAADPGIDLISLIDADRYFNGRGMGFQPDDLLARLALPPDGADAEGVAGIVDRLGAPTWKERRAALEELKRLGPDVIPLLEGHTDGASFEVGSSLHEAIQHIRGRLHGGEVERALAVRMLIGHADARAIPLLESMFDRGTDTDRVYARWGLAALGREVEPVPTPGLPETGPLPEGTVGVLRITSEALDGFAGFGDGLGAGMLGELWGELILDPVERAVDRVGNIRIDSGVHLSLHLSGGGTHGIWIFRGAWDRERLLDALDRGAADMPLPRVGEVAIYPIGNASNATLCFPEPGLMAVGLQGTDGLDAWLRARSGRDSVLQEDHPFRRGGVGLPEGATLAGWFPFGGAAGEFPKGDMIREAFPATLAGVDEARLWIDPATARLRIEVTYPDESAATAAEAAFPLEAAGVSASIAGHLGELAIMLPPDAIHAIEWLVDGMKEATVEREGDRVRIALSLGERGGLPAGVIFLPFIL